MKEIQLRRIMNERNLAVIGDSITAEEKTANMIKALCIVIPPKSVSDRTTLRNIVKFFSETAKAKGQPPDSIFKILIDFALEASGPFSRVPAAVFMSILKVQGRRRYAKRRRKDGKFVYMHREILDAPDGMQIDHVNGNGLDNRVANLRLCTATQNQRNAVKRANGSSRFKGVDWNKRQKKWRARITINKRTILIGRYCDEFRAAKAYDKKAIELFGEFANINFPSQKTNLPAGEQG